MGRLFVRIVMLIAVIAGSAWVIDASAETEKRPGAAPVGSQITYQGYIENAGEPANGDYDFEFKLYNADSGGSQIGTTVTREDVAVSQGVFTVNLDFGAVYYGSALWLQIGVRPGSSISAFTSLTPRQELASVPYAQFSLKAPWSGLTDVPSGLDDGDDDTTYTAGSGLVLSAGEFSVDFAGSGTADTAARSDHDHNGGALNLPAAAFNENDGDDTSLFFKWNRNDDYIYLYGSGASGGSIASSFDAPLNLPQGASIDSFTVYANDQDQVNDMQVILGCYRGELNTIVSDPIFSAFSVSTSGAGPDIQSSTNSLIINPDIDNDTYYYWCTATIIVDGAGDLLRFYGARIEYSMP
jgi:hypothetical protein